MHFWESVSKKEYASAMELVRNAVKHYGWYYAVKMEGWIRLKNESGYEVVIVSYRPKRRERNRKYMLGIHKYDPEGNYIDS